MMAQVDPRLHHPTGVIWRTGPRPYGGCRR